MAKLTDEQQQTLTKWVEEGATLNDVQTRLKEEFSIVLTYFETRLLVMELGLVIKDKKRDSSDDSAATSSAQADQDAADDFDSYDATTANQSYDQESALKDEDQTTISEDDAGIGGNISVSLDTLAIPGTMVSGKVTFSDGTNGAWYLDQFGRLGLRDVPVGYQPPESDIPVFQRELQKLLR